MSRTPSASRYLGIGSIPYSGMPGPPSGPVFRSTSTDSGVIRSEGSSMCAEICW